MRRLRLPQSRAGRALLASWAVALLGSACLIGVLQWLGPPPGIVASGPVRRLAAVAGRGASASWLPARALPAARSVLLARAEVPASRRSRAPILPRLEIAPLATALLEPAPHDPSAALPRIAGDGRRASVVYAADAPFVPAGSKRVAILLSGFGLSSAASQDAVDQLPAAVSFAVSPYAEDPAALLDAARKAGHELLLSLPMEPARSPLDDEGTEALTEQVNPDENARRLEWSLSRIQGYAGVTNAAGGLDGEAFAGSAQFPAIVGALARRGLFYLDATPQGAVPGAIEAAGADLRLDQPADLHLDQPAGVTSIDRQLAALEQVARVKGSAIGVAGPPFPVTIRRLADWIQALPARGLVLVPVSSLTRPPEQMLARSTP